MWGEMSLGEISLWRVVLIPISTADVSVHHQLRGESTITSSLSVYAKVLVDNLNGIKISAFLID